MVNKKLKDEIRNIKSTDGTTIKIDMDTRKVLEKLKGHRRETMGDVVRMAAFEKLERKLKNQGGNL